MKLTEDHIAYIVKDLNYRGIVAEGVQEELIDHICTATESEMKAGLRFIDAYHRVVESFGRTAGLRETQRQVLHEETKPKGMLKNYITVALRNLRKHRFYSFINVLGLSIGLAVCLIIVLFVLNELSFDRHFATAQRVYRVRSEIVFGGSEGRFLYAPAPLGPTLAQEFPEVEAAVRFRDRGSYLVKRTDENIKEPRTIWVDKDFFKVFPVPLVAGNPATALAEPNTVAISQSLAEKLFPGEEALGKTVVLDNELNVKVNAVYTDFPSQTHFHFNLLISLEGDPEAQQNRWYSNNFQTYFLLRPGANIQGVEAKLPNLVVERAMPQLKEVLGNDFSMEKFRAAGNRMAYFVQPLTDVHLYSHYTGEFEPNFDITYIYLFGAIAVFILMLACINFMNLSTARSANRAKEVGIRKVMGSFRSHLMRQFLTESVLLSFLSLLLALAIAYMLLPVFNDLSGRVLTLPFGSRWFYVIFLLAGILVGVAAGVYPSFFLSAFRPVQVLKGQVALGMKSGLIRSALVVFQFTVSIFLVIGTLAVYQQLNYIQTKKLGFNKDQVLVIDDAYALGSNRGAFKNEVMSSGKMERATMSGYLPVEGGFRSDNPWWIEGRDPAMQENLVSIQNWRVDHEYVKTLGMSIVQGRDFSDEFPSDSSAVILNEAAVKTFNFPGEVIGSRIATFADDGNEGPDRNKLQVLTVIGVVENFHFQSLKENFSPVMMFLSKRAGGPICFRFKSADAQEVIRIVEKQWKEMAPGQPFTYYFLDERFSRMYSAERQLGEVFGVFSILAVLIACLGLFALTAFTAEQRTKEIGIRKVLGASITSIVVLLSKEFGKLILIAFALAAPLAWLGINWWLKDYSYKTEIGVGLFLLSGLVAFTVAWLTMSFQSFRAAASDPVKSLRSE
ncbi:MAG: ABC transporter permease [Cyclobacteriaceae bacterium]|jgi:putative ABC transport system permease protein|nr:ABC transporter permease [Cyclobacteriaceae bacterium]